MFLVSNTIRKRIVYERSRELRPRCEFNPSMDVQPELPLPPPPLRPDQPYVPARMVNEFLYCPRLAYLEWVQGEWAESADTVEGRGVHRRVDSTPGQLPEAEAIGDDERIHARSITLSSDRLGLIARLGLIEVED